MWGRNNRNEGKEVAGKPLCAGAGGGVGGGGVKQRGEKTGMKKRKRKRCSRKPLSAGAGVSCFRSR